VSETSPACTLLYAAGLLACRSTQKKSPQQFIQLKSFVRWPFLPASQAKQFRETLSTTKSTSNRSMERARRAKKAGRQQVDESFMTSCLSFSLFSRFYLFILILDSILRARQSLLLLPFTGKVFFSMEIMLPRFCAWLPFLMGKRRDLQPLAGRAWMGRKVIEFQMTRARDSFKELWTAFSWCNNNIWSLVQLTYRLWLDLMAFHCDFHNFSCHNSDCMEWKIRFLFKDPREASSTHLHMTSCVNKTRHISGFLSWPS